MDLSLCVHDPMRENKMKKKMMIIFYYTSATTNKRIFCSVLTSHCSEKSQVSVPIYLILRRLQLLFSVMHWVIYLCLHVYVCSLFIIYICISSFFSYFLSILCTIQ